MANEKRLIDANRAMEIVRDQGIACLNAYPLTNYATLILREAPTVDAVEVVHGHWISKGYKIECSVCEHRVFLGTRDSVIHTEEKNACKYCPNCGAKMDGGY